MPVLSIIWTAVGANFTSYSFWCGNLGWKMNNRRFIAHEDEDESHSNLLRRTTIGNGSHAFLLSLQVNLINLQACLIFLLLGRSTCFSIWLDTRIRFRFDQPECQQPSILQKTLAPFTVSKWWFIFLSLLYYLTVHCIADIQGNIAILITSNVCLYMIGLRIFEELLEVEYLVRNYLVICMKWMTFYAMF